MQFTKCRGGIKNITEEINPRIESHVFRQLSKKVFWYPNKQNDYSKTLTFCNKLLFNNVIYPIMDPHKFHRVEI